MVKIAKYFWDVAQYNMELRGAIDIMCLHVLCSRMFTCLLLWYV